MGLAVSECLEASGGKRGLRVALFSGNYNYVRDGANQALNRLVGFLESSAGCEVRVFSPVTDTPAFEPVGILMPVPSISLPMRNEFRLALGISSEVRRAVEDFSPDIVHVSAPDILGTRAQTLAKRMDVPIVASFHTRFETYLDYYRLGVLRPFIDAHLARFYRRSDHVLAPTPAIAVELAKISGAAKVSLWPRGVDRSRFNPNRRDLAWRRVQGIADDELVVLFLGRLVLEKGIDTFISVVGALRDSGYPVRPLVVGAGPAQDLLDRLPEAVLTGHVDGDELGRAVASADILLHPSVTEAFGNVVLEAMASGVAIVGADAQSTVALIDHERTGLLCPPDAIEAYVGAIQRLMGSPETRARFGVAARRASAAYSWDASCGAVANVYRDLVEGGPAKLAARHEGTRGGRAR